MLKKLIDKFIFWLYDRIEQEKLRRKVLLDQVVEAAKLERVRKLEESKRKDSAAYVADIERRQAACTHLKGSRFFAAAKYFQDHAVNHHTFTDGHDRIKCTLCGKEWSKEKGNYEEGLKLVAQSTNTPSSSEFMPGEPVDRYAPGYAPPSKQNPDSPEERYMPFITTRWMNHIKELYKRAKTGSDA